MSAVDVVVTVLGAAGFAVASMRWLRVAQREHYLAGSTTRFAARWWSTTTWNVLLLSIAVLTAALSFAWALAGLGTIAVAVVGPRGLSLRGRTSRLAWTRRLRTAAAATAVIAVLVVVAGVALDRVAALASLTGMVAPLLVDAALWVLGPVERRVARRYTRRAAATLHRLAPTVVAITGSYGKTSTKQYARHLIAGTKRVVASPASFNNAAGLSRAITEHLTPGTDVFIAEMGTYGKGEIADLCEWVQPNVGVITAVGPVHLERMKSLEGIVEAKSEIFECVETAILNVDSFGLAAVADANRVAGKRVIACSAHGDDGVPVDIRVVADEDHLAVDAGEGRTARVTSRVQPTNLACAIAVAIAVDVPWEDIEPRLADLPQPDHRHALAVAASGVHVIDNTFSSNPASGEASLSLLAFTGDVEARRVVVTPGMVELGPRQEEENTRFASRASLVANDIVVVGQTNRKALMAGSADGLATIHEVATRDDAVDWVRSTLRAGDVVLYENDLPDHYP